MAKLTLVDLVGGYLSVASINANYDLLEVAMENTLSRDGKTPNTMSADIDMNSIGRITNLQDAVIGSEPITLNQAGALISISTTTLTQDNVGAVLWPQAALETANSVTATELQFYYGDVRRYGAKLDSSTDDTAAFNDAIQSGWMAFCDFGTAHIAGTIVLDGNDVSPINGGKHLRLSGQVVLQRFSGDATTPIIHVYGTANRLEGNKAVLRQNLYAHPDGILLVGQDPDEAAVPGVTNKLCTQNHISDLKIVGPENTAQELEGGHPGVYVHSAQRKLGDHTTITTYRNLFTSLDVINCDVLLELSTAANANMFIGCIFRQWIKAAIFFNGSYGNLFVSYNIESPLENIIGSATERFAIHFDKLNGGVESDTDAGYSITSANFNKMDGYCELPNSGNKVVRLIKINESGSVFGRNEVSNVGTLAAGLGASGSSVVASLGSNYVNGGGVIKDFTHIIFMQDFHVRPLDDGSGSTFGHTEWRSFNGRGVAIAEATQYDAFSMDNIATNATGMMVKLTYSAKADAIATIQIGEIMWAVFHESDGVRSYRKVYEHSTSLAKTQIMVPNCTIVQGGDGSNTTKATIGFLTLAPAGTNLFHISWRAELLTTDLETNQDYDDNLKIL